eukprot:jgi/Botrbrau1/15389/Bobra.43_2s0017.1
MVLASILFLSRTVWEEISQSETYILVSVAVGLILLAGLMSGLTLGLMGIDKVDLEVLIRSGSPREMNYAKRIAPILARPHLLLVTLLLVNAAAMEALPLVLDRLVSPVVAVILSVTAVLIFGEILPQAVCSKYGLAVGAYSAWLVRLLIYLVGVISFPISKLLDWSLGSEHGALFRRNQLKALVDIHGSGGTFEGAPLTDDEIHVIHGALDLAGKDASQAMTPIEQVFMISSSARLDENMINEILATGHSRIPVYRLSNRSDIVGVLLVKELALIDPEDALLVANLRLRPIPFLDASTPMYDMLTLFKTGRSHMVVLTKKPGEELSSPTHGARGMHGRRLARNKNVIQAALEAALDDCEPVGIITIEDVIEELIGGEILDETDRFVDNLKVERVNAAMLVRQLPSTLRTELLKRSKVEMLAASPTYFTVLENPSIPETSPLAAGTHDGGRYDGQYTCHDELGFVEEGRSAPVSFGSDPEHLRGSKSIPVAGRRFPLQRRSSDKMDLRLTRAKDLLQPIISVTCTDNGEVAGAGGSRPDGLQGIPSDVRNRLGEAAELLQPFLNPCEQ